MHKTYSYPLHIIINVMNYLGIILYSTIFQMYLHDHDADPLVMDFGFAISPTTHSLISVKQMKFVNLPQPYGHCEQDISSASNQGSRCKSCHPNEKCNDIMTPSMYTVSRCQLAAQKDLLCGKCHCKLAHMPGKSLYMLFMLYLTLIYSHHILLLQYCFYAHYISISYIILPIMIHFEALLIKFIGSVWRIVSHPFYHNQIYFSPRKMFRDDCILSCITYCLKLVYGTSGTVCYNHSTHGDKICSMEEICRCHSGSY